MKAGEKRERKREKVKKKRKKGFFKKKKSLKPKLAFDLKRKKNKDKKIFLMYLIYLISRFLGLY